MTLSASSADIAFDALLTALQREGFPLSPTDYIEFTAVFSQFTGSREEFKYHLAPILCRNREDQQKFYAIYDRYATPPAPSKTRTPGPINNPYITEKTATWFLRRASRRYYAWVFLLSLIAIVGRTVRYYIEQEKFHHLVGPVTIPDSTARATPAPDTILPPAPHRQKFVAKALKPLHPQSPEDKSILIPTGPEAEKENRVHSSAFAWLFMLGLASLCLSVSFFPLKKSRSRPHTDIGNRGDHGPLDIPFQPKDRLIHSLPILARIARDLAQPIPTDHYRLEIKATIRESINANGLLTPVYANIQRRPEWLVLIDKRNPLKAGLFAYLCRTLANYSLPVYYYYHDGNHLYSAEGSNTPINDYQLRQRHGDAQLIDFATAAAIPAPLTNTFNFGPPIETKNINRLRAYLDDEDLFQWLCAIAIYPTVRWEVLLAVGAAVLKERNAPHKLNFGSLLKLSRIAWLATNTGIIPTEIRLVLLKNLGLNEELVARRTILDLLRESDDIITAGSESFNDKMHQVHTQSFILFAHDTRRNKSHEMAARQFMSALDRQSTPDLATVLYLSNPDNRWATPIRSAEDPTLAANADRFINELLALKVIADPRIRTLFRNLAATLFFLLLTLYLFKDEIQPTALNRSLGLVTRDYPTGALTINIPVTPCLRQMTPGHYLLVTLNNYDNNRYSQLLDLDLAARDTLRATFTGITMRAKDTSLQAIQMILNKTLTIDCPSKKYYTNYTLNIKGDDCDTRLPKITPGFDQRPTPNTMHQ
jgi:hypothetical protein